MRETDTWPVIRSRWFTAFNGVRKVRVIVIHDMEAPEKVDTAITIAKYFATIQEKTPDGSWVKKSAHVCIDENHIVQCVADNDIAYAAPGANSDGIQIELAGYGAQTREQWLDEYGTALLDRAADCVAQYCLKYEIPVVHLTNEQLQAGEKGIVGHVQVSQVYKKSDHTDPGPNFPWDVFLARVQGAYTIREAAT